jgi:hypothetical protein
MASVGKLLNIGDIYLMERGGWATKPVASHYQHTMQDGKAIEEELIDGFFIGLMQKEKQNVRYKRRKLQRL